MPYPLCLRVCLRICLSPLPVGKDVPVAGVTTSPSPGPQEVITGSGSQEVFTRSVHNNCSRKLFTGVVHRIVHISCKQNGFLQVGAHATAQPSSPTPSAHPAGTEPGVLSLGHRRWVHTPNTSSYRGSCWSCTAHLCRESAHKAESHSETTLWQSCTRAKRTQQACTVSTGVSQRTVRTRHSQHTVSVESLGRWRWGHGWHAGNTCRQNHQQVIQQNL